MKKRRTLQLTRETLRTLGAGQGDAVWGGSVGGCTIDGCTSPSYGTYTCHSFGETCVSGCLACTDTCVDWCTPNTICQIHGLSCAGC